MPDYRKKGGGAAGYLLYLVIALALLAGAALLLPVYRDYRKKEAELAGLKRTLNEKRTRNAELTRQVGDLQTSPEAVEAVARKKFGYCREGETVYKYPSPRPEK